MRKLMLKKETLAELSGEELGQVQGGASGVSCTICVSGIVACVTFRCATLNDCVATLEAC